MPPVSWAPQRSRRRLAARAACAREPHERRALDADGEAIFAAVAPVLLAGALPEDKAARDAALAQTLDGIDAAVAGLSPTARAELAQLFALLALPPVRLGIARVSDAWPTRIARPMSGASSTAAATSRFTLMRAAYDALAPAHVRRVVRQPEFVAGDRLSGPARARVRA